MRLQYGLMLLAASASASGAPANARNFQELLNQNASKPLRIVDARGAHEGKVQNVGTDFICGSFSVSDKEAVRCYRFDAIRWVAVQGLGPDALVISVPEF